MAMHWLRGPDGAPLSRTRALNASLILDAARTLVETDGLAELSMRRLAERAGVSVRTIYNIFGDKHGLLSALVLQSCDAMDEAMAHSEATDPIERIWETITTSIAANCQYVPKAVVAAVVSDIPLYRDVAHRWSGTQLILDAIESATAAGALRREVEPSRLAELAGAMHAYRLRQWADGEIDEHTLVAGALHAFDICLLAVARPRARARLLEHLAALEPLLPDVLADPGRDEAAR